MVARVASGSRGPQEDLVSSATPLDPISHSHKVAEPPSMMMVDVVNGIVSVCRTYQLSDNGVALACMA